MPPASCPEQVMLYCSCLNMSGTVPQLQRGSVATRTYTQLSCHIHCSWLFIRRMTEVAHTKDYVPPRHLGQNNQKSRQHDEQH